MPIHQWSTTAADNDDAATSINWAEGQDPSTVNNSARQMMTDIAYFRDLIGGANTTGGSANAQTLTTGLSLSTYQNGLLMGFEAGFTNTGSCTLNVDSISAKTFKVNDQNLVGGEILAGNMYLCVYESDDDVIRLLNPSFQRGVVGVNAQTDDYTLVLADAGKLVTMSKGTANTLTIPANSSVAFPIGTIIAIRQKGAGTTSVTADTGVTLNGTSTGSADISGQYKGVTIIKEGTDAWSIVGQHSAVS